jgi:hypothetical protein
MSIIFFLTIVLPYTPDIKEMFIEIFSPQDFQTNRTYDSY